MNFHLHPRRDQLELARLILTDARFLFPTARADFLTLGQIVLDFDVSEMVDSRSSRSRCLFGSIRRRFVFDRCCRRLRFIDKLRDLEKMALAWRVNEAFMPPPEGIAAHQG
jgi:hypothetical protein